MTALYSWGKEQTLLLLVSLLPQSPGAGSDLTTDRKFSVP